MPGSQGGEPGEGEVGVRDRVAGRELSSVYRPPCALRLLCEKKNKGLRYAFVVVVVVVVTIHGSATATKLLEVTLNAWPTPKKIAVNPPRRQRTRAPGLPEEEGRRRPGPPLLGGKVRLKSSGLQGCPAPSVGLGVLVLRPYL